MDIYLVDFIILAIIAVVSAILALEVREIVYAIFFFDLVAVAIAGLFLLINAGYISMFIIAVYAGAVIVTILFAIMLTRRTKTGTEIVSHATIRARLGSIVLVGITVTLMVLLLYRWNWGTISEYPESVNGPIFDTIVQNYSFAFLALGLLLATTLIGSIALLRSDKKEVLEVEA